MKPDCVVTEAEFFGCLDDEVTPRLPAGLTMLKAVGQFRGDDGVLIREESFILNILYSLPKVRQSSKKIDAIRERY